MSHIAQTSVLMNSWQPSDRSKQAPGDAPQTSALDGRSSYSFGEDARIDVKAPFGSICRCRNVGAAGPRAAIGTRPLLASEQAPIAWGLGYLPF